MRKRSRTVIEMDSEEKELQISKKKKVFKSNRLHALIVGVIFGFCLEYFLASTGTYVVHPKMCTLEDLQPYKTKLETEKLEHYDEENDLDHYKREDFSYRIDDLVAERYKEKMKILCYVMTTAQYHLTRAAHIKQTWGKRCDILIFFSNVHNGELPAIALTEPENTTGDNSWNKTLQVYDYLYSHYYYKADWFVKADDTNYFIIENLRYLLSHYSPKEEWYIGCKYKSSIYKQGYMVDKAGYVLSKEALQKIAVVVVPHYQELLPSSLGRLRTDQKLGFLMERVQVKVIDSRDAYGKERFHPFSPRIHVMEFATNDSEINEWYSNRFYRNPDRNTVTCCSESAISFGYATPSLVYSMEYQTYNLRPFGIVKY